jgi:serine protease Do
MNNLNLFEPEKRVRSQAFARPTPTPGILLLVAWLLLPLSLFAAAPQIKFDDTPLPAEARPAISFKAVVQKVAPSVVNIYTAKTIREQPAFAPFFDDPLFRQFFGVPFESVPRERRERSLGSGVIVTEDGYILTNNHVVEGADEIKVALADDKTEYDAKLIGTDPQTDLAVIKIEGRRFPAITITDSDKVEVGDIVLAIGNPFGVGQTVTMGIVSAKSRGGMGIVDFEDFIQTDASINPGNSGGALVDVAGRLVGINQSIISSSPRGGNVGIGFSVPSNLARYVLERLIAEGKVTRGYLGVMIQPVTPELAQEFRLPDSNGALVSEVTPDSPAAKAGLKIGDVIVEFNGRKVSDSRQLRLMIAQTPPDTEVTLRVLRDGTPKTVKVKLAELPGAAASEGRPGSLRRPKQPDLLDGVVVDDLTPRSRRAFNIPEEVQGALIVQVAPNSPAAAAGLQPGDVILEINRRRVGSAEEAVRASQDVKGERVLLRVWSRGGSRYVVISAKPARP